MTETVRQAEEAARKAREAEAERERICMVEAQRKARAEAARRAREAAVERERIWVAEAQRKARLAEEEAARQARVLAQQEAARKARQEQWEARRLEIAEKEAAFTIQHVVLDFTIVTFGAGAAIQGILTGFESCRVHIKNLPLDANAKEVSELFTQQGIGLERFHIIGINNTPDGKQEAHVICPEDAKAMAIGLDGIDFRREKLTFEVFQNSSAGGMKASTGSSPDDLIISWRAPSVSFVATYSDMLQVQAKVRQLDNKMCAGRRVKVEVNKQPAGQHIRNFSQNAIMIRGLPPNVTDAEVKRFCGSDQLRRLKSNEYDPAQVPVMLRYHIEAKEKDQLKLLGDVSTNATTNMSTIHAHFNSWERAKEVYDSLDKQRFWFIGNASFQLRLDSPFQYTITISVQQYRAQRRRWDSLHEDIKDKKGCNLIINARDRVCIIRVGGGDRKAVGSLKVRVEVLAAGEKLQGWHRLIGLGAPGQQFLDSVLETTGALVRNDRKNRVLKVFGEPSSVDEARVMVDAELERLESLEQTVFLKRQSVRYFMKQGLAALREELGEDNVTLNITSSPCKITIRGTEAARHSLNRHIDESLQDSGIADEVQNDSQCPICYDEVTTPVQLACGHSYCTLCIRHFLNSACDSDTSKFPLSCMGDEDKCGVPIPIPAIQRYIPPQQFKQLLEAAFLTHIKHSPQDFKYCTTPDCSQVYRSSSALSSQVVHCPSCFSAVCSTCHEEEHEGMTCEERRIQSDPAEQERLNEELAMQSGFKKCPECKVWIEKTEGCNHMSCICGAHICWVCMGIFTSNTIYPHMNEAHGGLFTAAAAPAAIPAAAPVPAAHIQFLGRDDPDENYVVQVELLRQAALRLEQRRNPFRFGDLRLGAQHNGAEQIGLDRIAAVNRRAEQLRLAERDRTEQLRLEALRRDADVPRAERLGFGEQRGAQALDYTERIAQTEVNTRWRAELRRREQDQEARRHLEQLETRRRQEQEGTGWGCVVM